MDGGGNSYFGRGRGGRRGDNQIRGGKGQKPNRDGGKGRNSLNQPNPGGRRRCYADHQPPTQGQWINSRGYRQPPASEPHQIGGRAGAWGRLLLLLLSLLCLLIHLLELNRVSASWSKAWKLPVVPVELRLDLLASFGLRLIRH